jgi:tetratricopeptide (TPR) repeat protein
MAWQIAFKAWQDRPILGFGPNNFYYAFNKFYDPDFLNYGYGETWFDNAHSAIMNTLAVQGLFGLVFYCFIFIFSIYSLFKSYRCGYIDLHIFSVSFAFLAAHFVHNAFVFENPTSYLCFFFFIAFANQSTHKPVLATEKQNKKYEIYFPVYVYLVIFIPILFFIYITDIKPAKANMASFRMMKLVETGQDVLGLYKKVEKISSPHIDDLRIDFARTASQQLKALATIGPSERTKSIFLKVHEELNKDLALHPLDIRIHMLFYSLLEDGFAIFNEPKYILELEKIMDDAMQKSPKRQQIEYMAAAVKTQLRKTAEAEKILKQTIENNPKIADSWARLALMYKDTGRPVEAKKVIKEAISNGIVFSGNWKAFVDGL